LAHVKSLNFLCLKQWFKNKKEHSKNELIIYFPGHIIKKDRLCMYNVTMKYVHVTIVGMEKQSVLNFMNVFL